ncbi:hypothetical protein ACRC7T_07450 [Segnochrobactraceae bacterium EtOH-i3]
MSNVPGQLKTFFNGTDLLVREQLDFPGDTLVVYFSGRRGIEKLQKDETGDYLAGSGERFLGKHQLPALFFYGHWNHWWQTPEMDQVLDLLHSSGLLASYKTIVTYGMSMGGYGALMFSSRLGAHRVLAGMPQYSLDPARMPGEKRWDNDRRKITFRYDDMEVGLTKTGEVAVFFDPLFRPDRLHVDKLLQHRPIKALPVPFAVHGLGSALQDMGILSASIVTMIREGIDQQRFRSMAREARRKSPLYLSRLARTLVTRHKIAEALTVDRAAMLTLHDKVQSDPTYMERNSRSVLQFVTDAAELLVHVRRLDDAIELLRYWEPQFPEKRTVATRMAIAALLFANGRKEDGRAALHLALTSVAPVNRWVLREILQLILRYGTARDLRVVLLLHGARIRASTVLSTQFDRALARLEPDGPATRLPQKVQDALTLSSLWMEGKRYQWFGKQAIRPLSDILQAAPLPLQFSAGPRKARRRRPAALPRRVITRPEDQPKPIAKRKPVKRLPVAPQLPPLSHLRLLRILMDLEASGTVDAIRAFDKDRRAEVLANERLAVRFGTLLLKRGLLDLAIPYLRDCAPLASGDRSRLIQRRVIRLLRCAAPDAARQVLDAQPRGPEFDLLRAELAPRIAEARSRKAASAS